MVVWCVCARATTRSRPIYSNDPAELARRYLHDGAAWLHVVDLDGARSGQLANLAVIRAMVADGLQVQAGGGVRTEDDLRRLFDVGVQRVVLGSIAIGNPGTVAAWLDNFGPERLTIALDTRRVDGRLDAAQRGLDPNRLGHPGRTGPVVRATGRAPPLVHRHRARRHAGRTEPGSVSPPGEYRARTGRASLRRRALAGGAPCRPRRRRPRCDPWPRPAGRALYSGRMALAC